MKQWWRKRLMSWRIESRVNPFQGTPHEHYIFYRINQLFEWLIVVASIPSLALLLWSRAWADVAMTAPILGAFIWLFHGSAKQEKQAFQRAKKAREQARVEIAAEDRQEQRRRAWKSEQTAGEKDRQQQLARQKRKDRDRS